uniref:Uncharacterized protein n=1 Tax=Physcomitrium patens TaxID=3218 RepID=A0A2K1KUT8_PHYPA|nr:hypothetical protein PHYPA_004504 [Physcomitrium patens]
MDASKAEPMKKKWDIGSQCYVCQNAPMLIVLVAGGIFFQKATET